MGYNRSYYTHGAEPFAYQWHGRIQFPARDQSSLHGLGAADLLDAQLDESGTKTKTDAKFLPYVQQVQGLLQMLIGPAAASVPDLSITSLMVPLGKVLKLPMATMAQMTWRQVIAALQNMLPKSKPAGMSTGTKVGIGLGALALIYLVTK